MHPKKQFAIVYCLLMAVLIAFGAVKSCEYVMTPVRSDLGVVYDTVREYYCKARKEGKNYRLYIGKMNKKIARRTDKYQVTEQFLDIWEEQRLPCRCGD